MINWANVARAAEQGLAKDSPADLARYSGDLRSSFIDPGRELSLMTDLVELSRLGTALMLIRRDVVEGICADRSCPN